MKRILLTMLLLASSGVSAQMTDIALVAAARGWTLQQAVAHRAIADKFGRIQEQLATARPGLYAGAELSAVPDGAPTIEGFKSGALKIESITSDEVNVRAYGDTAIVTGRTTTKGQDKGRDRLRRIFSYLATLQSPPEIIGPVLRGFGLTFTLRVGR